MKNYRIMKNSKLSSRAQEATALNEKAIRVSQESGMRDSIPFSREVIERFKDDTEHEVRVQVARAHRNAVTALWEIGEYHKAVALAAEQIKLFGADLEDSDIEPWIRETLRTIAHGEMDEDKFEEDLSRSKELVFLLELHQMQRRRCAEL